MLLTLARSYVTWLLISVAVCVLGTAMSAFLTETPQPREFLISFVYNWNGLVVATTGIGALHFGVSTLKQQFHYLVSEILEIDPDAAGSVYFELERLFSWRNKQIIAVSVFVIGAAILYICGYPMVGLPHFLLWIFSSAMYYVGGMMFAYIVYAIRFFGTLERNIDRIRLKNDVHLLELENFNFYLSTLFLAGTVALYFAFRGTLTANFTFIPPFEWVDRLVNLFIPPGSSYGSVRSLLIYPMVVFAPFAIFAGFYMRLVLRKIYLTSIKQKIAEIDELASPFLEGASARRTGDRIIEIRNAVMDLKGKITNNNKSPSLVGIKDSPSIILILIIVAQFIVHNDPTIRGFMNGVFGLN